MKNQLFLLLISLFTIAAIFSSCKKEKESNSDNKTVTGAVLSDNKHLAGILAFHDMVNSGYLKTGEAISIEEAVEYTKGTLNLEYGCASYEFEIAHRTSFDLAVELNTEGKIDLTEAIDRYNEALGEIKAFYGSISAQQKQLIGVVVNLKEIQEEKIIVTFKPTVGTPPISIMNFGTTDWWEWGFEYGKCGGYEDPIYIGRDAAGEIEKKILARKAVPGAGYVYLDFWSPDFDIMADEHLNPDDLTPGDNIRDFLMYGNYDGMQNFNTCISNSDMNFYLTGTESVINEIKPYGYVFYDVVITGDIAYVSPYFYHHHMMPTYGLLYYSGQDPKSLN
jgi:hypothetical protein